MIRDKEKYSINYLIFRQPTEYILIMVPFLIGLLSAVFSVRSEEISSYSSDLITRKQFELIDTYLTFSKWSLAVLLAFFVCYRWSAMENDGSFGFWMTLGVNRFSFFIFSHLKTIGVLYLSQIFGLLVMIYLNSMRIGIDILLLLNLLVITNLIIIITMATIMGSIINNPEIASLVYLGLMIAVILLFSNGESFLGLIFMSDLQYKTASAFLSLTVSLIAGAILFFLSLQMFLRMDMEM